MRDLRTLPKAHLHLHLEAAMRPATMEELALEAGVATPVTSGFTDFTEFGQLYQGLLAVFGVKENILRVLDEAVADAAADGAVHVEFGGAPLYHAAVFGSAEAALGALLDQAAESSQEHGVSVGFMPTLNRMADPEAMMETALLAAKYAGRGVVGLGLANDERGFPPGPFAACFAVAKDAGLLSTPHAGELDGPSSVRGALDALQADRILHGVRAVEDPSLLEEIAERGVCLDVCPTSNLQLGVVPTLEAHPLPQLLDAGVRCSINADDPTLFGPGLLEEYELSRTVLGLSDEQLAACAWSSIECSAATDDVKQRSKGAVDAWLAAS
ncbi:adenosine deaminase [Kineococcus rhizosphaerae]|uniref:Adenosine deaminase n=1 Tax=Kineococcus rhizosphaerae TaxID=559628 RepID=A0A2T0QX74_9ACTN|nr:adenosine deaminase [Kineococcus rhizosphaerae]PRY10495.1 adenosine deaminase [Kineococcus rhizosphaerae]